MKQHVERLDETAEFLKGAGQLGRTIVGLKNTGELGLTHETEFQ